MYIYSTSTYGSYRTYTLPSESWQLNGWSVSAGDQKIAGLIPIWGSETFFLKPGSHVWSKRKSKSKRNTSSSHAWNRETSARTRKRKNFLFLILVLVLALALASHVWTCDYISLSRKLFNFKLPSCKSFHIYVIMLIIYIQTYQDCCISSTYVACIRTSTHGSSLMVRVLSLR